MLFFKLYCFIFFLVLAAADDDPKRSVEEFIEAFGKLQSPGDTLFKHLESVIEYSTAFAAQGDATAMMMVKAAKHVIDPNSPELNAIKLLSGFLANATKNIYEGIATLTTQVKEHNRKEAFAVYDNMVKAYLAPTMDMLIWVSQNNNSIFYDDFASRCKNPIVSPLQLLHNVELLMVTNCDITKIDESVKIHAAVLAFFNEIEPEFNSRFTTTELYKYHSYKKAFILNLMHHDRYQAEKILKLVKQEIADVSTLEQLKYLLKAFTQNNQGYCITEEVINYHSYKHMDVSIGIRKKIREIQILYLSGVLCADAIAQNDPERLKYELNKLANLVIKICNHTSKYVPAKLTADWKDGPVLERLKGYIKPLKTDDPKTFNDIALDVSDFLDDFGPESYAHQVVIGKGYNDSYFMSFERSQDYCLFLVNYNNVNVYACRYPADAMSSTNSRDRNALKWYDENKQDMMNIVETYYDSPNCTVMAAHIAQALNMPTLNSTELYNGVVVLHDSKFFWRTPDVKIGVSNQTMLSTSAMNYFTIWHSGFDMNQWVLVFIL